MTTRRSPINIKDAAGKPIKVQAAKPKFDAAGTCFVAFQCVRNTPGRPKYTAIYIHLAGVWTFVQEVPEIYGIPEIECRPDGSAFISGLNRDADEWCRADIEGWEKTHA